MPEYLEKLRPDRDLQCYFERPSAIAALSEASAGGFTVSGCWRQQFDWAVVEWNRDNVFEHPAFRNLPDGDLSGLYLSYEEERHHCIALDSTWTATVDWPSLRIWAAAADGVERLYKVPLNDHATPVEDDFTGASATFRLTGSLTPGDYIELVWLQQHYTAMVYGYHTIELILFELAGAINAQHQADPAANPMTALADGDSITLMWPASAGANGNRIGVYTNVTGEGTEIWSPGWQRLSGGMSPLRWRIDLDFAALVDENGAAVPTSAVRKMRWTWAAEVQTGTFSRTEFSVVVSNWAVAGTNRRYQVAGPASRRIEEDDRTKLEYSGEWSEARGNYSGGAIRHTVAAGASVKCTYEHPHYHRLWLGTRRGVNCGQVAVAVDGGAPQYLTLTLDDDVLVRMAVSQVSGQGTHSVTITNIGGGSFYFDFLEMVVATEELPQFPPARQMTLATDWDTDHSMALAPERTAWMIRSLGFTGRANFYVGALWFYEMWCSGHTYASATVTFSGATEFGKATELWLGPTCISHVSFIGDTPASIAKAFELEINGGTASLWAGADGGVLTIHARRMGTAGDGMEISANTENSGLIIEVSGDTAGGVDGRWLTDLENVPRLNRAVRDWSRSHIRALDGYGIDAATAFSMELQHGDDSPEAGIAQRFPDGVAKWVETPALQTNFSPQSTAFWREVYLEAAALMDEAGARPYLQFGEVQWWYFPAPTGGMPFYDAYTTSRFQAEYGRTMHVFQDGQALPAEYPAESAFLAGLIGEFTNAVVAFVRQTYPQARFEVLYALDVNEAPLNQVVNLPATWSPAILDCFKTENFTYTGERDLNKARSSIRLPLGLGFPRERCSHLVGVGGYTTPWDKESLMAAGEGVESVVLFALDQYCLLGHMRPNSDLRRSLYMG